MPLLREVIMVLCGTLWQKKPLLKDCCLSDRFDELEEYTIKNMEDVSIGIRELKRQIELQHDILVKTLNQAVETINSLKGEK